jgi:hypothetical protein
MRPHERLDRPTGRWHGPSARECRRRGRDARVTRSCPAFEALETRDLPSSHPLGPALPGHHLPASDVQQFVPILYPPGTPQPTAAEVDRESFVDKAVGSYTVGPGRFNTQSITIHGYGKPSTSNIALVNHFQFVIAEPTDPSQPVTGVINFLGENFLQNGTNLLLDLEGPTGTEVNGLPTHLNWVRDSTSGTPFTGTGAALPAYSNFPTNYFDAQGNLSAPTGAPGDEPTSVNNWNMGLGDVTLKFIPSPHPVAGSMGSGKVILVFHGLINTSGAQNADDKNTN